MQQRKLTPYFFFITIGVVVTLITTVSGLLSLVFEILNHVFSDALSDTYTYGYNSYAFDAIRSALAVVIIAFPLYLVMENRWYKAAKKTLTDFDEGLRKWALYVILFLTSVTMMIDLITLVRYFVGGEITSRFILKVAVTLIVVGSVGWYYVRRLHTVSEKKWNLLITITSSIAILGVIVWAFTVIGGPQNQRALKMDQRRLDDLQSIQYSVINYWQQTESLPTSIDALATPLSNYMVPKDPEFQKGAPYEYRVTGSTAFELCATFQAPLPEGYIPSLNEGAYPMNSGAVSSPVFPGNMKNDAWQHDIGRTCFARTIDPVFYPPFPKPKQ